MLHTNDFNMVLVEYDSEAKAALLSAAVLAFMCLTKAMKLYKDRRKFTIRRWPYKSKTCILIIMNYMITFAEEGTV